MNKLYEFHESNMGKDRGRVEGMLRKINDLHNTSKLVAAGLISVNESSDSRRDVC